MKRKVIQIAESTQLISLPRKWALQHKISKGDELDIKEEGNSLIISTEKSKALGSIAANATGLDRDSTMFLVRALYKNGYDEITINYDTQTCENIRTGEKEKYEEVISREIGRLNGVEIFTQKDNYCIIRTISEDTIKAFDTMLRRIFLLSNEALSDLVEGYEKGNHSTLEALQKKHDIITKFVVYCQRLLNKIGYSDFKKTDTMFHILEVIDTIMDLVKYNARNIIKENVSASKDGLTICKQIRQSFGMYYDLYYNFSLPKVSELNKNRYSVLKNIESTRTKIPKGELSVLINMEQILESILSLTNSRVALEY
jgi:phosphate uptake regulator